MFLGELDLRKWVTYAFDVTLKDDAYSRGTPGAAMELKLCSIQMLKVGVTCRGESPQRCP